ncbi:MAG: ABC transporter substrate-binding protein [Anaerolineae bacterium]
MAQRMGSTRRNVLRAGLALGCLATGAGLSACGSTPTPQVVEKVVEKVVTQVVEKEVTKIVEGTPQVVKETVIVEVAPTPVASGPVEVRFAHAMGDDGQKVFETVLADFMASNPDIQVSVEPTFDWDPQKYLVQAASGTAPDILWGDEHFMYHLSTKGVLRDLGPYLESGEVTLDKLAPIQQYFTWQGKQHGLAIWYGAFGLYYNKTAFDDAGLAYPTDDWTWENDFLPAAQALTKDLNGDGLADEYGFRTQYGWPNPWGSFIWGFGGEFFNEDGTEFYLCDAPNYAGLEWYLDLMLKHKVAPDPEAEDALAGGGNLFVLGAVKMQVGSSWNLTANRKIEDFEWDIAPMPKGPAGRYSVLSTDSVSIYSQSKAPDQTWKVIETLLGEAAGKVYCEELKGPVPSNLAAQQYFVLPNEPPTNQQLFVEVPDWVRVPMMSPYEYIISDPFYSTLESATLGHITLAEGMTEVCPQIKEALAEEIETVNAYLGQ